jgi:hypothetical protein
MPWYDQYPQGFGNQQRTSTMSPQQMMQFGFGLMTPPKMQPLPYQGGGGGGMQPLPYQGGNDGGTQTLPNRFDPLDSVSDEDLARAFYKRQSRLQIGNRSYGGR